MEIGKIQINTIGEKEQQGGVSGGGDSNIEYLLFNAETDLMTYGEILGLFGYLVKFPTKIETFSMLQLLGSAINDAIAVAIDTTAIVDFQGERKSVKDLALTLGGDLSLLPRITKEQFYTL